MTLLDSREAIAGSRVPLSIRIDELLAATRGRLMGPTTVSSFTGAAVDSRHVTPGCCFVALRGERVDGHDYVAAAVRAGAVAALVQRQVELPAGRDVALVGVADPLTALQEMAATWRRRFSVRIIGITGSTGKTIAKEIVADVLSQERRVLRNEGNLNSETGLPMTLLQLDPSHELGVLEMSMYTEGEIARLAEISEPEVGVVLAVHPTHLERAGSIEAISRAKSELPAALPAAPEGLAVLNADDPRVYTMASVTRATVRTFGLGPAADVRATDVTSLGLSGTAFELVAPWGRRKMRSANPGSHLVPHALAAAAVAEHVGVSLDAVEAALAAGSHAEHRMVVAAAASGATLVDDTYNASPVSVTAALLFLAETPVPAGRHRYAVLGDMLELGPDEERLHREVGARAAEVVDGLVTVGERGAWIADGARAAGLATVLVTADPDEAVEELDRSLAPTGGDIVLLKASRGIELDRAVDRLTGREPVRS